MKFIFIALFAFASVANAQTFQSKLNFSRMYGNFNAGQYEATITIKPVEGDAVVTIERYPHNYEDIHCMTFAEVKVATMEVTLRNAYGWSQTLSRELIASTSEDEYSEECTVPDSAFQGKRLAFVTANLNKPFVLPVKPTGEYETVDAWLSPFMIGFSLDLEFAANPGKGLALVKLNTKSLEQSLNSLSQKQSQLSYYVTMALPSSQLSIGMGEVEMKK